MKNASTAFKNELNNNNRRYVKSVRITLADQTILQLTNADFWQNGLKISSASSGSGSFDIGAVVIGQLTLNINNIEDKFSSYDFTNAIIDNVKVGLVLPDETTEHLAYGIFTVNNANYNGSIINLTAYDNIYKFDRPYSESNLKYPATLNEIVRDACSKCGVTLQSVEFSNDDFVVNERPTDEAITFRNILQWAAQISCNFCVADEYGRLVLKWYDVRVLDGLTHIDGGAFNPWGENDIISGGTFEPWTQDNIIDGGTFSDLKVFHHLYSWNQLNVATDDVVITGIRVTDEIEGEGGTESVSTLSGKEGYVLEISQNKLIQGRTTEVSNFIGQKIIGMKFRPFSGSTLSNPLLEPGDIVIVSDRKEGNYNTVITSSDFQPGAFHPIACSAKSPARNSAQRYSESTQAYVDARKQINKEKTERQKAIDDLSNRLENSPGLYTTIEKDSAGGSIYYLHDKPTLAESSIVWKMTAEAFGVSTNGGKDWNAGLTVDGDVIARILYTIGVNANWIRTGSMVADFIKGGTLTLGGQNNTNGVMRILDNSGTQIGRWDKDGITASKGTFRGAVYAESGEFTGKVTATSGSFSGTVNATDGSFTGTVNATDGTFNGVVNARDGSFTGKVTTNEGKIGDWEITGGNLTNGLPYTGQENSNATGMGTYGTDWAFWAGNGRFTVKQNGRLRAKEAEINGTVNASSGTFNNVTIAGSNINSSSLSGSAGNISGGNYSNPYMSGGTLASTGGNYAGSCSRSTLASCSLGGTSLSTGNGGGYFSANSVGSARMYGPNTAQVSSGGTTYIDGAAIALQRGDVTVYSNLTVLGSSNKSRCVETRDYGNRFLDAYETPTPTFADYGVAQIDDTGHCYIIIDPVFSEVVSSKMPVIFLTKYGQGNLWVDIDTTNHDTLHVCGTPGLKFAWETRYEQAFVWTERLRNQNPDNGKSNERDYESENLVYIEHEMPDILPSALEYAEQVTRMSPDYGEMGINEYIVCKKTAIDYSEEGFEYFENFERSMEYYEQSYKFYIPYNK